MNYFNIRQVCSNCLRGAKVFQVDLSLYDEDGRLNRLVQNMECFSFVCQFCSTICLLDFYRFSHPDLICHLKCLHNFIIKQQDDIKQLDVIIDNLHSIMKKLKEDKEENEDRKP